MKADQTSVTPHTTRYRVDRLVQRFGADKLQAALATCKDEAQAAALLDAYCLSWFGPITPRSPRSDKGRWHALPERVWQLTCTTCGGLFDASRWDARYCSNACRQKAYRLRPAEVPA